VAEAGSQRFADFTWPARWNGSEISAVLSQSGADVMATGFFGVLRFRLDDTASVAAIARYARRFASMVEDAGMSYGITWTGGGLCDRCGTARAWYRVLAFCTACCGDVGLCAGCFLAHADEVTAELGERTDVDAVPARHRVELAALAVRHREEQAALNHD
jgi:hypothetical protein